MKLKIVFTTLGILTIYQELFEVVDAKSVKSDIEVNDFNPCSDVEKDCNLDEGDDGFKTVNSDCKISVSYE